MRTVCLLLLASSIAAGAGASPEALPAARGGEWEKAMRDLASVGFVGAFTEQTHTTSSALPVGDAKHTEEVVEITIAADGSRERRLVRFVKEGQDRTEQERARRAESEKKAPPSPHPSTTTPSQSTVNRGVAATRQGGGVALSISARLPFGDDAALFVLGPERTEEGLAIRDFSPARGKEKLEGMTKGRLAYTAATGMPAWIEMEFLRVSFPVSQCKVRHEFAVLGDTVYTSRRIIETAGGLPLMKKRRLIIEIEVSDLVPAVLR